MTTETKNNPYKANGYESRTDYLYALAEDYNVDFGDVVALAELLGKSEDFDGLVSMVQDMADGI